MSHVRSGHDIATREGLSETLEKVDEILGISYVSVAHCNDSVGVLGSRLDRHADIGSGMIGEEGFRVILGNSKIARCPSFWKHPRSAWKMTKRNLAAIRRLAKEAVIW